MLIPHQTTRIAIFAAIVAITLMGCKEKKKTTKNATTSSKIVDSTPPVRTDAGPERVRPSIETPAETKQANSDSAQSFTREAGDAAFPNEIAKPAAKMSSTAKAGEYWRYIGMSCHKATTAGEALDAVVERLKATKRPASIQEVEGRIMIVSSQGEFETRFTPSPGVRCHPGRFGFAIQMDKKATP